MPQTNLNDVGPRQTSLDECEHHPCVIVQSVIPSTVGTGPVTKTVFYPTRDGKGIFTLWNKEGVTVHSEDPHTFTAHSHDTVEADNIRETRGAAVHIYPLNSIIGFYPEGRSGAGYFPIPEDCCVSTLEGQSYIFRSNGGAQGPYLSPALSALLPPSNQPSNASQGSSQHPFALQHMPLSSANSHHRIDVSTDDPRYLDNSTIADGRTSLDPFTFNNSINGQHKDDRFVNPHSIFSNFANFAKHQTGPSPGHSHGPEWRGNINGELDM